MRWQHLPPAVTMVLAAAAVASAVEFKFAPPDGLECEQRYKRSFVKDFGDAAPRREDLAESITHLVYEKVADGYRVTATTRASQLTRDGKPIDDPILKALIGHPIIYEVGRDGVLNEVHGFSAVVDGLMAALPPEAQTAVAGVLNAETMRNREVAEWNGRIASFVGRQAKVGESWQGQDVFPMPSGPIKYTSVTRISKIEQRAERPMVTINFAYATDSEGVANMMEQVMKGLPTSKVPTAVLSGEPTIRGGGERVIDASTMTIERESVSRVISAQFETPDGASMVMVGTETKDYAFKCRP